MQRDYICVCVAAHVLHCAALFPSLVISQPNTAFTFLTNSEPKSLIRRPISANTSSLFSPPPCADVQTTRFRCKKKKNVSWIWLWKRGIFSLTYLSHLLRRSVRSSMQIHVGPAQHDVIRFLHLDEREESRSGRRNAYERRGKKSAKGHNGVIRLSETNVQSEILTLHWIWILLPSFHISVCRHWPGSTGFTKRTWERRPQGREKSTDAHPHSATRFTVERSNLQLLMGLTCKWLDCMLALSGSVRFWY